jgi:hypothetical protein
MIRLFLHCSQTNGDVQELYDGACYRFYHLFAVALLATTLYTSIDKVDSQVYVI